jgi:AcrR family transcriptional regulator
MPKVSESHLEAQRERILDAATACFARKGFTATTMPEICREARLSTGAVYRYFLTKEDIIEACVLRHRQDRSRRLASVIGEDDVPHALDGFYELQTRRLLAAGPDESAQVMLHSYGEALHNSHVSNIVRDDWNEISGLMEELVRRAQGTGDMNPDLDSEAVAALLIAIHDGLVLQKLVAPSSSELMAKVLEVARAIFVSGQRR